MHLTGIVGPPCPFEVTLKGRDAMRSDESCLCEPQFEAGLIICPHCSTVYGTMAQVYSMRGPATKRKGD